MNCGPTCIKQARLNYQKEYLAMSLPLSSAMFTMMLFEVEVGCSRTSDKALKYTKFSVPLPSKTAALSLTTSFQLDATFKAPPATQRCYATAPNLCQETIRLTTSAPSVNRTATSIPPYNSSSTQNVTTKCARRASTAFSPRGPHLVPFHTAGRLSERKAFIKLSSRTLRWREKWI
jgi:hypothetical protein